MPSDLLKATGTVRRRASIRARLQNPGPFCYLDAKAKYGNCKAHQRLQTKRREKVTNSSELCFSKTRRYKNITLKEKSQTEKGTFCRKR